MGITFISGPMSGYEDFNYPLFYKVGRYLDGLGVRFLSPAKGWTGAEILPPEPEFAKPWEFYMRESIKKLMDCDRILMLPGWENSRGATIEKELAIILDMPIEYWKEQ